MDISVLIPLQVLSGKQPWSEVRNDVAIILRLAKGEKPARPECRTMHDLHWSFIQQCWSQMEERPTAEEIVITIQQFLDQSPQLQSLRDMPASPRVAATTVNSGNYRCQWLSCEQACEDLDELMLHMGSLHDMRGPAERLLVCHWMTEGRICGGDYRRSAFRRHMRTHLHLRHVCITCGKTFSRADTLRSHARRCTQI